MTPADTQLVIQLRDHLDVEMVLHRSLLSLAEAKQRHIIAADMPAFSQLLQQEHKPLAEMNRLRMQRERLLRSLGERLRIPAHELTIGRILGLVPEILRNELAARREQLKTLLQRLRALNENNLVLIRQSLGFIRDIVAIVLGDPASVSEVYDQRGVQSGSGPGYGRLVNARG